MRRELIPGLLAARPNPAHYALAELQQRGKLHAVITQNIDGLHQKAGVSENMVFQLHGDSSHAKCLSCTTRCGSASRVRWTRCAGR